MTSVCMVNDCSFVAANLTPHLENWFDVSQVNRSRGLYAKTVGLWWKIRNSEADLYHVHYALQDAWITSKIRSLDVLHCHGSDIRVTLHHPVYGRIVRSNLKKARRVLYATPDMAMVRRYREDAIYVPTPIETAMFYPRPYKNGGGLRAVYFYKWYEQIPQSIVKLCRDNDVDLHMLAPRVPYDEMPKLLNQYDVFVDRFSITSPSKTALEAMACGLNVIGWDTEQPERKLLPRNSDLECTDYIRRKHDVTKIARQVKEIYEELL